MMAMVKTVPGVNTDIATPAGGNSYPTLTVTWDEQKFNFTVAQCDAHAEALEVDASRWGPGSNGICPNAL